MRMTLKKCGELAGVSAACVSNILNGKTSEYKEETVLRVQEIARKHNYRPNAIAKSLVTKATMTLGMIIPDISNPYYPELAKGIENRALELGYHVIYVNSDEDPQKEIDAFHTLEQKWVDGVIFVPSDYSEIDDAFIEDYPIPVVIADRALGLKSAKGEIVADDYQGSRLAAKHLIQNGHKQILVLSGDEKTGSMSDRILGFLDEVRENHIAIDEEYLIYGRHKAEFGHQAVIDFIQKRKHFDAIFAGSDMIAIGVLQALRELDYSVPEDVSVIGFDDIYLSQYLVPSLTTIRQPKFEMGKQAVEMVVESVDAKAGTTSKSVRLDTDLVIRKSVGKNEKNV